MTDETSSTETTETTVTKTETVNENTENIPPTTETLITPPKVEPEVPKTTPVVPPQVIVPEPIPEWISYDLLVYGQAFKDAVTGKRVNPSAVAFNEQTGKYEYSDYFFGEE